MLKRNCIQDKRKKKKTDIDKKRTFITGLVEKELKSQNILKMSEDDQVFDLSKINPKHLKFCPT
jgi:hypothetical protein